MKDDHQTLQYIIDCLFFGDGANYPCREVERQKTKVVFDTSDRAGLYLLSLYIDDDGVVHLDIGDSDE